jgi:ribosomal protein L11 methyltransferase
MPKNKICYELCIETAKEQKELVAHLLTQLEIGDFIYGSIDCDLEAEYDPSTATKDLYEMLNVNTPILIYNEDLIFLKSIQSALEMLFPKVGLPVTPSPFKIQEIADQNWRESWKKSFRPVLVQDQFAIIPPWEKPENFSQKHKIIIDPGMAFGTGQHETTRICLEMMLTYPAPKRFFDVGTGSGILAIAAKMFGAEFVFGNDIDPECMAVANENIIKNNVTGITFTPVPVAEVPENNFDLIVANIQCRPLKKLVPEILKRLSEHGVVIFSGILVSEKEEFIEFLELNDGKVIDHRDLNHWCGIACQKK